MGIFGRVNLKYQGSVTSQISRYARFIYLFITFIFIIIFCSVSNTSYLKNRLVQFEDGLSSPF